MFCMKCGTKLPDDAEFCFKCGTRVPKAAAGSTTESQPGPETNGTNLAEQRQNPSAENPTPAKAAPPGDSRQP